MIHKRYDVGATIVDVYMVDIANLQTKEDKRIVSDEQSVILENRGSFVKLQVSQMAPAVKRFWIWGFEI